jgi:hypothetical protein
MGYRWDGKKFIQIPFQVDQVFARYLTNNASGFAFYSGTDQHLDYAYDREGFRFLANTPAADPNHPTADVCKAIPYKAPDGGFYDGQPTTPSPNGFHLVDKDELVFMAKDAGNPAPSGAVMPAGILDSYAITVTDPDTGKQGYVYVALGGDKGPAVKYTAANSPYVHYQRDADAGIFNYSQSSYGGYGAAPKGWYCNPDGTLAVDPKTGKARVGQRRPKDTAWITTPRYAFRYDGRWLMTEIHISPKTTVTWTRRASCTTTAPTSSTAGRPARSSSRRAARRRAAATRRRPPTGAAAPSCWVRRPARCASSAPPGAPTPPPTTSAARSSTPTRFATRTRCGST